MEGFEGGKDERGEGGQSLKDDILAGAREADYASNPAIWCLGGCLCLILSLYIAFIIWAVAAIASSLEVTETDCGVVYNLWWFNAIGLFGALLVVLQSMFRQPALGVVGALIYLVLAICGVLMWSRMSERCDMWFSQNYFDLFLLFKINTVFYCVFFCCSCGLLCSSAMGMLGGNHREGSFSDIPGANSAENLEEELRRAAGNGDVPEVKNLLDRKADPNAADDNGWSALHHAANYGRNDVAQRLINARANLDAESKNGDTPLRLAAGRGEVETLLRSMGARENDLAGAGGAVTVDYV